MKIKNIAAVLLLIWTCGFSSVVSAAEIQTVQLTEENQLVYTKDKAELAGAFDGMAPGDSRTVVIKIENQNSHKASFFISQKTTDALEEAGKASGGAYEFQVEIGNDTNRTSLLDADAGGYAENVASAEGLAEITELNEYRYMTALDPGESADVYVTLTLDGEGMDSANGIDYSRAAGAMEFEFRAVLCRRQKAGCDHKLCDGVRRRQCGDKGCKESYSKDCHRTACSTGKWCQDRRSSDSDGICRSSGGRYCDCRDCGEKKKGGA